MPEDKMIEAIVAVISNGLCVERYGYRQASITGVFYETEYTSDPEHPICKLRKDMGRRCGVDPDNHEVYVVSLDEIHESYVSFADFKMRIGVWLVKTPNQV
jgi:hypothetical protein